MPGGDGAGGAGGTNDMMASLNASSKNLQDAIAAVTKERRSADDIEEGGGSGSVSVGKLTGEDYMFDFSGKVNREQSRNGLRRCIVSFLNGFACCPLTAVISCLDRSRMGR